MKGAAVISLLAVILGVMSCAYPVGRSERYSVRLENLGSRKIIIPDFKLYESKEFCTAGGHVWPGTSAGSAPYYEKPDERLTIEWQIANTPDVMRDAVSINLPPGFDNYGSSIVFYFDSDKKKLIVAYELSDEASGQSSVVDATGASFDVRRVLERE